MRSLKGVITAALATAVVIGSVGINSAEARPRHYHRGNAAAVGAVIGLFGTIAAIAAADSYRERYYDGGYYGPGYGYAPNYGYRRWHHHRHWR